MDVKGIKRRADHDVVQDLISIKSKLESSLGTLKAERESLRAKINFVKDMKEQMRKKKAAELLELYKLKVSRIDADKRVSNQLNHIKSLKKVVDNVVNGINSKVSLSDHEIVSKQTRVSIEFILNYYNEDALQMELMKRTNNVRERRVEYTKVESDYNDLKRKIEEEKRQKEREKIREQEKAREEEERLNNLERNKIRSEEAERRDEFLHQGRSYTPISNVQPPFLGNIRSPGIDSKEAEQNLYLRDDEFPSLTSNGQISARLPTFALQPTKPSRNTFSQLLRWD